ncbi:hypothetical protein VP1G_11142 [Cytospora mali]|uniref:Uncharacterized protein n=1 Tax=Cytospora mali TaxID=578113 RepID=A0A194V6M6_CYTMA|nr:hypothetical protein VP1G_11142 [Valsa mali var. pyri (nom. inval.)]
MAVLSYIWHHGRPITRSGFLMFLQLPASRTWSTQRSMCRGRASPANGLDTRHREPSSFHAFSNSVIDGPYGQSGQRLLWSRRAKSITADAIDDGFIIGENGPGSLLSLCLLHKHEQHSWGFDDRSDDLVLQVSFAPLLADLSCPSNV